MTGDTTKPDPDAATLRRLALMAGHDLAPERAAALVGDAKALAEADRRLAKIDLGSAAASGPPWGRSDD